MSTSNDNEIGEPPAHCTSPDLESSESTHEETEPPAPDDNKTIISGNCDICAKKDNFKTHALQKCKECGVLVHELCYALIPTGVNNPDFVCHACKAVGTEIELNIPSKIGGCGDKMGKNRELFVQEKRPTECVLCTYKRGVHAMHPVYDTYGPEGRHLVLPKSGDIAHRKEKRLAWVHTLCAQFINAYHSTKSFVYGCDINGDYEDDNGNGDEDEETSDGEHENECHICDNGGGRLLCCDGCVKVYHTECLQVDLDSLPDPWYCPLCASSKSGSTETKKDDVEESKEEAKEGEEAKAVDDVNQADEAEEFDGDEEEAAAFKIGTEVSKIFSIDGKRRPFVGKVEKFKPKSKTYTIRYEDGDAEDLTEKKVAEIVVTLNSSATKKPRTSVNDQPALMATHHWVFVDKSDKERYASMVDHHKLKCFICKRDDSHKSSLRIPVQCTAGEGKEVLSDFPKSLRRPANRCFTAMHVGCARWNAPMLYAKVNNKKLRFCFCYPGQKADFVNDGSDKKEKYTEPAANCFCRVHARVLIEQANKNNAQSSDSDNDDGEDQEDSAAAEKAAKLSAEIAAKKKKKRILLDDDEESD